LNTTQSLALEGWLTQFKFSMGTRIFFGENCIHHNKSEFDQYGKRAFVVAGKSSGSISGALDDLLSVLEGKCTSVFIYDRVENNPSLEDVRVAGVLAEAFEPDIIIGLGGGSPIDASKAVAVLAVNDIDPVKLFDNIYPNKPLPVIAIPTTAGTGSEVTPYANLIRHDLKTKMSFGNESTVPVKAFLDARYLSSMPYEITVNTALDALTHAIEGYLNRRSTPLTDLMALESIRIFGQCVHDLIDKNISCETTEMLMYSSMLAGLVIANTGTGYLHRIGYSLTYFRGIPHGRANGLLLKEFLEFNRDTLGNRIDQILRAFNCQDLSELGVLMDKLIPAKEHFDEDEIRGYASMTMKHSSTFYNIKRVEEEDLFNIYQKTFMG